MMNESANIYYNPTPLKRAKMIKRLGVVAIARRAGTSIGSVSRILNGKAPNSKYLGPVCDVLGVSIESLFSCDAFAASGDGGGE